jgi:hypothetical protein
MRGSSGLGATAILRSPLAALRLPQDDRGDSLAALRLPQDDREDSLARPIARTAMPATSNALRRARAKSAACGPSP